MSGKFNMDDYVDVNERIQEFYAKYPEGSLQSQLTEVESPDGTLIGWKCQAWAYRSPEDKLPGIGHAVEPVPGRTPYTKDSEAMNAETSAWGRAIVALGFTTKKIASANEVLARQGSAGEPATPGKGGQRGKSSGETKDVASPAGTFKAPRNGKPTKAELTALTTVVDALIQAGEVTNEQLMNAAKSGTPWPELASVIEREQVLSLTERLGRHAARKGIALT